MPICDPPVSVSDWDAQPLALIQACEKKPYLSFLRAQTDWDSIAAMVDAIEELPAEPVASTQAATPQETFLHLAKTWREETENLSSLTRIVSHPAYQQIIDLGKNEKPIMSLILKEWQDHGGYWATALHSISGENPVAPEHVGNPTKIREDWMAWGRVRGYL